MNIKFNRKVVAFKAGLTVLSSSLVSFAEEQQLVNKIVIPLKGAFKK